MHYATTLAALLSAGLVSAYDVPDNLRQIYDNHKSGKCNQELASGYTDGINGDKSFVYCGDIDGAIFLHSSSNGGQYGNMDVDCDGENNTDGDCANDPSGQSQTAFKSDLKQYGINDMDANVHPYVVFGNSNYKPQDDGMEPLSVMAVVCGGQLFYGVWGDTNGAKTTGEASISLAQMCYPDEGLNGDNGHEDHDVLYIGFKGKNAVPGDKADWKTKDTKAFEESIKDIGDKLVAGLKA